MAIARVLCPALIGREAELSILEDALLATLRGDGRLVVVGGEAGMGKTRLVHELAERAQRLKCVVMSGACSEAEITLPYLPFLEGVGNYLATQDLDKLRDRLGPAADDLAHLFPQMGHPSTSGEDATQAKLRMFESILLLLRDASGARALLLIVEDLQWSDPATRELLDYATRRLRGTKVLIIATYRSDEMHRKHALLPAIEGWRRSGQAELMHLRALPPSAVADMVCTIFEEPSLSDEFREFLHGRSEGNPFVLEEMLRDALDRGDIFRTETGWDRKALGEMRIPNTVRDTILHRLERLSLDDVAVLSAASVVSRSFDLSALAAVTGIGESAVLAALETCITYQLLEEEERNSARYRFRHALTREAVYENMVAPRRQQLHARMAEVLGSRINRVSVDLANHLFMAGKYDEAVVMCIEAADDAIHARAYRDAAALLERAAPHVEDQVERGRLLCRAGDAYWNNGETTATKGLLEQGIADLEAGGLAKEAAAWRVLLGRCFWEVQRSDLARQQFERARDVLEVAGPSEALAVAYIRLAQLTQFDHEGDAGLEESRRASDIARAAGSSMALAWSWMVMGSAEIWLGVVDEGFKHIEDSYQAALAGGHNFQILNAIYNGVWMGVHLGRGHTAQKWVERIASTVATAIPTSPYLQAMTILHQGRVPEALDLARKAMGRARDAGNQKMVWRVNVVMAHALAEGMQAEEAVAELPSISTRVDRMDAVYDTAARVRTHLAARDPQEALRDAKSVAPDLVGVGSPAEAVSEGARLDPAWLRGFLEALPKHAGPDSTPFDAAAFGRLALYEGRFDDAVRELRRSEAAFRDEGFLLDAWHIGRALAEAEARGGDLRAARERLEAITSDAELAGARLAARLARDTSINLGFDVVAVSEVAPPTAGGDRVGTGERMVTVLFADVRGFTEMTGNSPPADMLERIGSLHRWASHEVSRNHGLIDKFAGDAIMATFNISGQSVDHALRALKAAIAIIDKAALAGLPVGAGIAVGPAVVGRLAGSANLSVLGEVTNLAARLQTQSPAGDVTLSEEAHRRVRSWLAERQIESERLDLKLKGFSAPVVAYRIGTGVAAPSGS